MAMMFFVRFLILTPVGFFIIFLIMKRIWETNRDEMKQKLGVPPEKINSCQALLINVILLLILSTNGQLTVFSLLLAITTAILCGWLLTKAAIKIGIEVRMGYYYNRKLIPTKKIPVLEIIKPLAETKVELD